MVLPNQLKQTARKSTGGLPPKATMKRPADNSDEDEEDGFSVESPVNGNGSKINSSKPASKKQNVEEAFTAEDSSSCDSFPSCDGNGTTEAAGTGKAKSSKKPLEQVTVDLSSEDEDLEEEEIDDEDFDEEELDEDDDEAGDDDVGDSDE